MRKLLPILVAVAILLMLAPAAGTWKWNTHGGVYGTRGISKVVFDRIKNDLGVADDIKNNLDWELVRPGSIAPDKWHQEPYFIDSTHVMTYSENRGGEWLLSVQTAQTAGAWDNVSYYLGIASHYWAEVLQYTMHDNVRSYFEENYGAELGYQIWNSYDDHLEIQVERYRPKDPALIVQDDRTPYGSLTGFINAATSEIDKFIENTMESDDPDNENRWFWKWIKSPKCEASDYSVYSNGNANAEYYGSKELVDMATELVYSGWAYALGIEGSVTTQRITWGEWWSREHRTPGVVF